MAEQKFYFKNFVRNNNTKRRPVKGEYYLPSVQYGTPKDTSVVKRSSGQHSYWSTYYIVTPKPGFDPNKVEKTFKVVSQEITIEINGVSYDKKEAEALYTALGAALGL